VGVRADEPKGEMTLVRGGKGELARKRKKLRCEKVGKSPRAWPGIQGRAGGGPAGRRR